MMKNNLFLQALKKIIAGFVAIGVLLFLPAGTLCYWNASYVFVDSIDSRFNYFICHNVSIYSNHCSQNE